MAFAYTRNLRSPTTADLAKGAEYWRNAEAVARQRLATAENSRARERQMERIRFCSVAAYQAGSFVYLG